jgi:hypothetical protein
MTYRTEPRSTRIGSDVSSAEVGKGRRVLARAALILLAVAGLYQGLWAQLDPRSFFEEFPGGESWIAANGPYNEHLARDVGGLVNGLAVVAIIAAWTLSKPLLTATAAGWLVYALPHLGYHLAEPLNDAGMQSFNVLVLASQVVLPVLGLVGVAWARATRVPDELTSQPAHR